MSFLKKWGLVFICCTGLLILAACGPQAAPDEPPAIRYGEDICDECNMIIDDARFAASYVTMTGDVRRFDDIGDMLVYSQKHDEAVHIYWVHDYDSAEWINAETATFVLSPNLTTPMAWGLAAFADETGAEAFITENGGSSMTFAGLLREVETGAIDPNTLSDHFQSIPSEQMEEK